ncbi:uncharacterized protein LOC117101769 [Anneissia japonica]|uniref:uncharacterized protein LOC117101769 n=1 Tax=Anneissia japonica TaxID=1529436 RepID=UPI0014257EDB|nr:uncharacterized protein LOC117101769 [Anneissia japonica]
MLIACSLQAIMSKDCKLEKVVASTIFVPIIIFLSIFYLYKRCRKEPQQQLPPVFVPDDPGLENGESEEPCPRPDITGHYFYHQPVVSWVDTSRRCTLPSTTEYLIHNQEIQNTAEANCYDNAAIFKSSESLQSDSGFVDSFRYWKMQQHLKLQKRRMEKREKTLQKLLAETTLHENSFNTQPLVFQKKNPIVNTRSCSCKHTRICLRKPRKQPSRC